MEIQVSREIAARVADVLAECGAVFVEDEMVDALAAALEAFLMAACLRPVPPVA